jgi:hypothetical protein
MHLIRLAYFFFSYEAALADSEESIAIKPDFAKGYGFLPVLDFLMLVVLAVSNVHSKSGGLARGLASRTWGAHMTLSLHY